MLSIFFFSSFFSLINWYSKWQLSYWKIYSSNFLNIRPLWSTRKALAISDGNRWIWKKANPINFFHRIEQTSRKERAKNPLWKLKILENTSYLPLAALIFWGCSKHMLFHRDAEGNEWWCSRLNETFFL